VVKHDSKTICSYLIRGVYCTRGSEQSCPYCYAPLCPSHLAKHIKVCWKRVKHALEFTPQGQLGWGPTTLVLKTPELLWDAIYLFDVFNRGGVELTPCWDRSESEGGRQ